MFILLYKTRYHVICLQCFTNVSHASGAPLLTIEPSVVEEVGHAGRQILEHLGHVHRAHATVVKVHPAVDARVEHVGSVVTTACHFLTMMVHHWNMWITQNAFMLLTRENYLHSLQFYVSVF